MGPRSLWVLGALLALALAGDHSLDTPPEVHALDGGSSEGSDTLMESMSGRDAATSVAQPDVKELLARIAAMEEETEETKKKLASQEEETKKKLASQEEEMAAQKEEMAAQKEETKKKLASQEEEMASQEEETKRQMAAQKEEMAAQKEETKRQMDEQQKKHAKKMAILESTEQKLKEHEAREAKHVKKIQEHESKEAAQTKKLKQYEARDAKQVKMLTGCLKPERDEEAKIESEIQTLGAETKATEAKLSAAEMKHQAERSAAAIRPAVGENGAWGKNDQGWVHRSDHSRCEAASCCSAKEALAQCLVKPEALGGGFETVNMHENPESFQWKFDSSDNRILHCDDDTPEKLQYKSKCSDYDLPQYCELAKSSRRRNWGGDVAENCKTSCCQYSEGMTDAEYLEKRLKRLEEQADGCPYDLKKEDDQSGCQESWCNNANARTNRLTCRWTCNPHCNPALPFVSYSSATYVPAATIADGHRHCDDKYTVMAQEKGVYSGTDKPLNRHKKVPVRVAVCGKCVSNEYSLHPAYASDGKILGVCRPLAEHDLYLEMDVTCGTDGKNDDGSYCSGDPMPLKCQEFVKEWGRMQNSNPQSSSATGVVDGVHVSTSGLKDHGIEDRALAFTCAHVSVTDFSGDVAWFSDGATPVSGTVYRLVRGEIAECHSQRESNPHDLGCVNKQVVKSCHSKLVQMNASSSYGVGTSGLNAAQAAWDAFKPSVFEAGVDGDWSECDPLALRRATSVGRL